MAVKSAFLRGLAVFSFAFLLSLEYWNLYIAANDEAVVVVGSQRILGGEDIYRDWDTHLSPGSFLLGALWFGILGFQAPSTRLAFACIFGLTAVVVDLISQRCLSGRWQWLPTLLWGTCGVAEFPVLSYHWLASGMAATSLWRGLLWVEQPNRKNALWLGAAVAGAGWFLQSEGLVGVLMVVLWTLRFRLRSVLWVLFGCVLTSLLLWLPVCGEWGLIVEQNISLGKHLRFNHKPYSLANLTFFLSHYEGLSPAQGLIAFTAGSSHIFINVLRYAGFPVLLLWTCWTSERRRNRTEAALVYGMVGWALGSANRQTLLYVSFLNPGWVVLITLGLRRLPGARWWAAGLATLEIFGWSARFMLKQQIYAYPLSTRSGVYYLADPQVSQALNVIYSWLGELPPRTPVLAFPYAVSVYSLENFTNPIRRQTLIPFLDPPAAFESARLEVESKKVPWLLYLAPDTAEIEGETGIPADLLKQGWEEARQHLTRGYEVRRSIGGASLYQRKPEGTP